MELTLRRNVVRAAGGVVRRVGATGAEVLLVHRPRYTDWTFPKGKAKPGEPDDAAALREVEEETGLRCSLIEELPSTSYHDSRGRQKIVRYWTMKPQSGEFSPHDEVDAVLWLRHAEAAERLSYHRDLDVLGAVQPPLVVVRHASAGEREEWAASDAARPLDARGRSQAEALVEQLSGFEVDRIVSSPLARCVQTLEPLARRRGVELELSEDLAEGAGADAVRALASSLEGTAAVFCGHGPDLEPLFGRIRKAASVVVDAGGGKLMELGRLPPPA
jgi:8-oxo-(d)GTP phosphatase